MQIVDLLPGRPLSPDPPRQPDLGAPGGVEPPGNRLEAEVVDRRVASEQDATPLVARRACHLVHHGYPQNA